MLQLQWSGPRSKRLFEQKTKSACKLLPLDILLGKQGMEWRRSPLQTNYEWDAAGHHVNEMLCIALVNSICSWTIVSAGLCWIWKKRSVSDHYKWWNVQASQNKDSKGRQRYWEFCWRQSASRTWEAIRLWPAAGLWCYQSLRWCSNHMDGNGKVLQGGPRVYSTQDCSTANNENNHWCDVVLRTEGKSISTTFMWTKIVSSLHVRMKLA